MGLTLINYCCDKQKPPFSKESFLLYREGYNRSSRLPSINNNMFWVRHSFVAHSLTVSQALSLQTHDEGSLSCCTSLIWKVVEAMSSHHVSGGFMRSNQLANLRRMLQDTFTVQLANPPLHFCWLWPGYEPSTLANKHLPA